MGPANVSALARSLIRQRQGQGVQQGGGLPGDSQTLAGLGGQIQWGGQHFNSPAELVAWMNARGQHTNVDQFLGNHHGLAALFGQRQAAAGGGGPLGGGPGAGVSPFGAAAPGDAPAFAGIPPTVTPPGPPGPTGSMAGYPTQGLLPGLRPVTMGQQMVRRRKLAQPGYGVQPL